MPGNICVAFGGETAYIKVQPKSYASSSGNKVGNIMDIQPNEFYEFAQIDTISLTLKGYLAGTYQEYMFEFTATRDAMNITLKSEQPLHWSVQPQVKAGYKYQVSVLNGVVLFAEVAVS